MKYIYTVMIIMAVGSVAAQNANFATVGDDNNCNFRIGSTLIQDAIDDGSYDEIRIKNGVYAEGLVLNDISTRLIGGYANCTDAQNNIKTIDIFNNVIVNDPNNIFATGLQVFGNQNINNIYIEDMSFSGGYQGVYIQDSNATIVMNRVLVADNTLTGEFNSGAGIAVQDGNVRLSLSNSLVLNNDSSAADGGGFFCEGDNNNITATNITFGSNAASSYGGGIALEDGCKMTLLAGENSQFSLNTAGFDGGGVSVRSGADFDFFATVEGPASMINNEARNGGAIYASGLGSNVTVGEGVIKFNEARLDGGAIYATDSASVRVGSQVNNGSVFDPSNCYWEAGRCTALIQNSAPSGGVFFANDQASVSLSKSHIEKNRADVGVIGVVDGLGVFNVSDSLIYNNGNDGLNVNGLEFDDIHLFLLRQGGNFFSSSIKLSTIVDNNFSRDLISNTIGWINVTKSIISETTLNQIYESDPGTTETFDCLVVHESSSLVGSVNVTVADPQFLDRTNQDYHLSANSPAIDLCASESGTDLDGDRRGFDDPTVSNQAGTSDAGADETYINDIIFEDGFE